ncbi:MULTISPECIES: hypothetical protein [unclassified Myroides]|uniref:hypothetical protein n=1 Tax=unclassified Myroides TaxID=2642485 RepID=UPI003D2F6FA1
MKKIYICAVLGLLFASCSTDEGKSEVGQQAMEVQNGTQANWGSVISAIENASSVYSEYVSTKDMISKVEGKAWANPNFAGLVTNAYVTPTEQEVTKIMTSDAEQLIKDTNYSATVKMYMKQLLVTNQAWTVSPEANPSLKAREVKMLNFIKEINDPDDEWNGRKTLAFVHGFQKDEASAVVFAVLSHQYKKIK